VPLEGQMVADLCVTGGYAQYAIRPALLLVTVPDGVDRTEVVCIPLAYLTAYQMLTRYRNLPAGATILIIGASGTVGTALLDLARHLGLKAIGTCSAQNMPAVARFGAAAIDYHAGDFVAPVRRLTADRPGGPGVDIAFDAIGGAHFGRSFACLAAGGLLVGYGSQTMAVGDSPRGIQVRHGDTVPAVANGRPSPGRDRQTAAHGCERGSHPHRQGRTWRQDCAATLVRLAQSAPAAPTSMICGRIMGIEEFAGSDGP
jgi:NADPH:quinone reductase-like Zn-dependent oxidoreductase